MIVHPELDVVIADPGVCMSCGGKVVGKVHGHCTRCRTRMTAVPAREAEIDPAAAAKQVLARRALARKRLIPYICHMNPRYVVEWVHIDLAARLERFVRAVENEESPRLIINMPPRRGKTELASRALASWVYGNHPDWDFIAMTHTMGLAVDNSRDVQGYINKKAYKQLFPETTIDPNNKGAAGWRTTEEGRYQPAGAEKGISGRGAKIALVDDPHRDKDAYSETVRDTVQRTYKSSVRTRLDPGGGIIIIQTRWVHDDLTGRVIEEEGLVEDGGAWEQVVYPEEATQDEYRTPSGVIVSLPGPETTLLRKKGEVLSPKRYSAQSNLEHKKDIITWAALFQQNPTGDGAGTFDEALMTKCACRMEDIPEGLVKYSIWDTAVSQKEGSCDSAEVVFGVDIRENLWLLDVQLGHWDSLDISERIVESWRTHKQEVVGIEKTNHSVAVKPFLERYLEDTPGVDITIVELEHGNKDKVLRSRPIQARARQGKVRIPIDAPWYEVIKKQIMNYPAKPNDAADAFFYMGQLLEQMQGPRAIKPKPKASWRDKLSMTKTQRDWRMS